jgi:hypothetical protein
MNILEAADTKATAYWLIAPALCHDREAFNEHRGVVPYTPQEEEAFLLVTPYPTRHASREGNDDIICIQ